MRQSSLSRTGLALLLFVTISGSARTADRPPYARLLPERVSGDPSQANWNTPQFLQADAKGRVFLLHGDNLQVDQLLPSGKTVVRRAARDGEAAAVAGHPVSEAVISPDGSSWLLLSLADHLSILHGDDRRELPAAGWVVSALAYTGDGPVIAVLPASVGGENATGAPLKQADWDKPPFLLRLHNQAWQTLATQQPLAPNERHNVRAHSSMVDFKGARDTRLTSGRKGTLWVAQQNAHLLRHYSSLGVLEESVAVGGGQVQWRDRTEEEWKLLDQQAHRVGAKVDRDSLGKAQVVRVIRGLTSQDSRVYLAVETPEGLALDRWEGETRVLERLLLAKIEPGPGRIALAAGHDGLYIAARGLGEPIWRLDWQQLEDAKWKPVPDAVLRPPA